MGKSAAAGGVDDPAAVMGQFWKQNFSKERERQQKWQEQFDLKKRERGIDSGDNVTLLMARSIGKEIENEHPELLVHAAMP